MEASALNAPASLSRLPLGGSLLRLRSDEQLLALFRSGHDEAFRVLHDRYRQRLFAYVRQMLSAGSRQDAEDVLQDVFVRAYGALRNDNQLQGSVELEVRIANDGKVSNTRVRGSLRDPEVSKCVQNLARNWVFHSPSGGSCAVFKAPYNFTPKN